MDHTSYQDMSQIFITQAGASMALFPIKLQPHWKNSLIMCEDITGPEDVTITQFTQLSNHQVSNMRHCMISGASPDCSISILGGQTSWPAVVIWRWWDDLPHLFEVMSQPVEQRYNALFSFISIVRLKKAASLSR